MVSKVLYNVLPHSFPHSHTHSYAGGGGCHDKGSQQLLVFSVSCTEPIRGSVSCARTVSNCYSASYAGGCVEVIHTRSNVGDLLSENRIWEEMVL